jgi:diphosphomevalonate decarboxylase
MTLDNHVSAPSNIALLKYWGKVAGQLPINPSLSFTLKKSKTNIAYQFSKRQDKKIVLESFQFDGKDNQEFCAKLQNKILKVFAVRNYPFGINLSLSTSNTFPHSAGIASSASSMAAVAKMFAQIYSIRDLFEISSLAREFSGSASRSVFEGFALWGYTTKLNQSHQNYAININDQIHPEFHDLQDWIFVTSEKTKSVSSSLGHERMDEHPFKDARIKNANSRLTKFLSLLEVAPSVEFFELLEQEALELHALMMTSNPAVILMEPESLALMKKITHLRSLGIQCGYTLDAGSSVHFIFPKNQLLIIKDFLDKEYFGIQGRDYQSVIFDECSLC